MKQYYVKPPAKLKSRDPKLPVTFRTTTAYICHQAYDDVAKRTRQSLVASFNLATDPLNPEINITDKGRAAGYSVAPDHRAMVEKFLRRHGTKGRAKVPRGVLARVRATIEKLVRSELASPGQAVEVPTPQSNPKLGFDRKAIDPSVTPLPEPDELPEAKLERHLRAIESACDEVVALMPESARHFKRGYEFRPETVRQVQRVWFKASDAIAALNGRQPLKRPKNWEPMRDRVLGARRSQ